MSTLRAASDLDLAKRCCAGERAAQRDLFHREKRRVHATLYRVLGQNGEMEDLVQEAFLEIFKGLSGFRGEATLGAWIDRVTVRIAYAHIARRKPAAVSLSVVSDVRAKDATAEERAMSREAARRLYAALDRIEARQRIAYVLHVIDGRPIADVASAMEATAVLTKVRIWRARNAVEAIAKRDPLLKSFLPAAEAGDEEGDAMGKPDIEPLTERQWSRIERDLFARVAEGAADSGASGPRVEAPRWWSARAAAVLVLAGAAAAVGGGVALRSLTAPAPAEHLAVSPSRITTDAAGSHVSVGEATLDVGPQSTVTVRGDDTRGVTVVLERGRVECEVPPRHGRPPFAVQAGEVVVRVVGTHFAVTRGASSVEVGVQRGVVQVTDGDAHVDVRAGETWPAAAPPPLAVPDSTASAPSGTAAAPASSLSPRDRYAAASRLEASRPDQAVAIYQELAAKGGPWGMNALFAEGRLAADRGHTDEARRLLDEYLSRYPSGPNADDARQLEQRLR